VASSLSGAWLSGAARDLDEGTKPAGLSVLQPTGPDFVLIVESAKALGLKIPTKLLAAVRRGD
jgi:hypothetical protein